MVKRGLYYVEKVKELTESQVINIKEKLIKYKNELIRKNKIDDSIKKDINNYNGIKDIRYLFNEYEDEYEDIRCLFNENEDVDEDKITHKDIERDTYYAEKIKKNKIKITHKESPFKSIIEDIKRGLYHVEKMNNLSTSDIKNIKKN